MATSASGPATGEDWGGATGDDGGAGTGPLAADGGAGGPGTADTGGAAGPGVRATGGAGLGTPVLRASEANRERPASSRTPRTRNRRDRRWMWLSPASRRSNAANSASSMITPSTPTKIVQPSGSNGSGRPTTFAPATLAPAGRNSRPDGTTSATIDAEAPPPAARYNSWPHRSHPAGAGAMSMTSWTPPGS
ncbi:MAG TPA: hypothetical protein VFG87_23805 [Amycolatopsis sp.]|nr:hypothetical protein [Amycolatopsis sp.]